MVIAGGESHKTGQGGDTAERVARLERWARERFGGFRVPAWVAWLVTFHVV